MSFYRYLRKVEIINGSLLSRQIILPLWLKRSFILRIWILFGLEFDSGGTNLSARDQEKSCTQCRLKVSTNEIISQTEIYQQNLRVKKKYHLLSCAYRDLLEGRPKLKKYIFYKGHLILKNFQSPKIGHFLGLWQNCGFYSSR